MPRNRTYEAERTTIRKLLQNLGHRVTLKSKPLPAVFLDHGISASFHGETWLLVYADVLAFYTTKAKSLT